MDKAKFYQRLLAETAQTRDDFANLPKVLSIESIGMSREKYQRFLTQLYHIVWHFCPIMSQAASRMSDDRRIFRMNLWHEIEEEKGHEEWVALDYVAAGGSLGTLKQSEPEAAVQALIGYNYFVADRMPAGVFGMRFALEMIACDFANDAVEAIAAATGLPASEKTGFRFLLSHAVMDAQHIKELSVLLDQIDRSEDERAIVAAAKVNYFQFAQLLED
jgi:heme oxygenase